MRAAAPGRARRVAAAVTLVVAGALLAGPGAGAQDGVPAEVVEVGWWSRRPGASEQPAGGFEVAAMVGQDLSVAALRVRVAPGALVTSARLVLEEASVAGGDVAQLQVCAGPPDWAPANPGAWSDAPEPDCTSAAALDRQAAGARWVGDVTVHLLDGDEVTLMVVPGEGEGLPAAGFQLAFEGATVVVEGQAGGAGGGGDAGVDWRTGDGGGGTGVAPGGAAPPAGPGSGFTPAPAPAPVGGPVGGGPGTGDAAVPAGPAGEGGDAGAPPPGGEQVGLGAGPVAASGAPTERPWHRLLVLVPLSALVGAAVAVGRPRLRDDPPALLRRLTG